MAHDRPRTPARVSGQWPALALAIAVHVVFIAVLVFSLRWQNRKPEPVTAELYAPAPKAATVEPIETKPPPPPTPAEPPPPAPPPPEPAPPPQPAPPPKPVPKPEPKIERPDTRAADIAARKVKGDEERRKREQALREKAEREKREAAEREAEKKKLAEQQREAEKKKQAEQQRRVAEARERQQREAEALKAQAEREQATRVAQADAAAASRAQADYIRRIQAKVKGNVVLPPEMPGNPEAIFDVVQLPTGEIIDAVLRKSSGVRAYDDAVQRAIIKSSPLPRPDRPELFQRTLTLKFRPLD